MKYFQLRLDPEDYEALKERMRVEKMDSLQQAGVAAVRAWIAGPVPQSVPPSEQKASGFSTFILRLLSSGDSLWYVRLAAILGSGHKIAIRALQQNLVAFCYLAVGRDPGDSHAGEIDLDPGTQALIDSATQIIDDAENTLVEVGSNPKGGKSGRKKTG